MGVWLMSNKTLYVPSLLLLSMLILSLLVAMTGPLVSAIGIKQYTEDIWVNANSDRPLYDNNYTTDTVVVEYTEAAIGSPYTWIRIIVNTQNLLSGGVDPSFVYIMVTPNPAEGAWYVTNNGIPVDRNATWSELQSSVDTTKISYMNITNYGNISVILLGFKDLTNLTKYKIDDIPGPNSDSIIGTFDSLYDTELYVIFEDITPDRAMSDNKFRIILDVIPPVELEPDPSMISVDTNVTMVKYGWGIATLIDYTELLDYINGTVYDITGEDVTLLTGTAYSSVNVTVEIYNNNEPSTEREWLVNITEGVKEDNPGPKYYSTFYSVVIGEKKLSLTATIDDFAPVGADPTDYLSSTYGYYTKFVYKYERVEIEANYTSAKNVTIIIGPVEVEANSDTASGTYKKYTVKATEEITATTDTNPLAPSGELNPGDNVTLLLHNLPATATINEVQLIRGNETIVIGSDELTVNDSYKDSGKYIVKFKIPYKEWGGVDTEVRVIIDTTHYVNEDPECNIVYIKVYPYILTFVIKSTTLYAEEDSNGYNATFIPGNTTAPGDYIMVKGYGFLTPTNEGEELTDNLTAYVDSTEITVIHAMDKGDGEIITLLKMTDTGGSPIPTGTYTLKIMVGSDPDNSGTKDMEVTIDPELEKLFIDPYWVYNGTVYKIHHSKLFGVLDLTYPLVGDEPNDEFQPTEIPSYYSHVFEFISYNSVEIQVYNKIYDMQFSWVTVSLTNGYGLWNPAGVEVDFLPMGEYTWFINGETPTAIDNRTIFTIGIQIDIDFLPEGFDPTGYRGMDLVVNAVGLPPNDDINVSIHYEVQAYWNKTGEWYSNLNNTPWWKGDFNLTVHSDSLGTGSVSINTTETYPTEYVTNATHELMTYLGLSENGTALFNFMINGTITHIYNATTEFTDIRGVQLDFHILFNVSANYSITWVLGSVSAISRVNFTILVPEIVLPGDSITVQIFLHNTPVWDQLVLPDYLIHESDVVKGWELYVWLVDPVTNEPVATVHGTHLDHPEWLIRKDVDNDGEREVWWVVNVQAPLSSSDKTYRVDARLILSVRTYGLPPQINVSDQLKHVVMNYTGRTGYDLKDTGIMIGGDKQLVTVLGLLYAKLVEIRDHVVVIETVVNDTYRYLTVNITDFLEYINDTLVVIQGDIAVIKSDIGDIKANLTTLLDLMRQAHVKLDIILDNLTVLKYEIEDTNRTIHLRLDSIDATLEDIITRLADIKAELVEYGDNITEAIRAVNETLYWKIDAVNESLTLQIRITKEDIIALLREVNETILGRIDALETELKAYIDDKTVYIKGLIYDAVDNITTNVTIELHNVETEITSMLNDMLTNLTIQLTTLKSDLETYINATAENLKIHIEGLSEDVKENITIEIRTAREDILTSIDNALTTILNRIDMLEQHINASIEIAKDETIVFINDSKNTIIAHIDSCCTDLRDLIVNRTTEILSRLDTIENTLIANITASLNDLRAYIETVNSTLYLKIESETDYIVTTLSTLIESVYNNLTTRLDEINASITSTIKYYGDEIIAKLDAVNSTLYIEIDNARQEILNAITTAYDNLLNKIYELGDNITVLINDKTLEVESYIKSKAEETVTNVSLKIDDAASTIISELKSYIANKTSEVIARIDELQDNVTLSIKALGDTVTAMIDSTNRSLHVKIDNYYDATIEFLKAMNTSLFSRLDSLEASLTLLIENKTVYLEGVLHDVESNVLYNVTMEVTSAKEEILSALEASTMNIISRIDLAEQNIIANITAVSDRLYAFINDTRHVILAEIDECCSNLTELVKAKALEIIARLDEFEENVVANITYYANVLETDIISTNVTLHAKLEDVNLSLSDLIRAVNESIMDRLDELEGDLLIWIEYETSRLEADLYDVQDNITYYLTVEIENAREEITSLITIESTDIKTKIDDAKNSIILQINDLETTVTAKLDHLTIMLNESNATIVSELLAIETTLDNVIDLINTVADNLDTKIESVVTSANNSVCSLVLRVGDDIKVTVTGSKDEIKNLVNTVSNDIKGGISGLESLVKTKFSDLAKVVSENTTAIMNYISTELAKKLNETARGISEAETSIKSKLDEKTEDITQKVDSVDSKLVTYGLVTLILLVVVIGLVGYSVIAFRRG